VQSEVLLRTGSDELRHCTDLAGRSAGWKAAEDDEGEWHGSIHIFERDPIYDAVVQFDSSSATGISIRWQGILDPNINEEYKTGVPLSIDVPLVFRGILCGRRP
jgi:hypothetical protein